MDFAELRERIDRRESIKNKECRKCGLGCKAENVCQINQIPSKDNDVLMVVGDYPTQYDAESDTVMKSGKESLFWNIALTAIIGSKRSQFYTSYAVKCKPEGDAKPKKEHIAACKSYLVQEIKAIRPKAVLLLGATAMEAFGIKGGVTSKRGMYVEKRVKIGEDEYHSFRAYVTYSPAYVQMNGTAPVRLNFAKDINEAYEHATGTAKELKMSRIVMCDTTEKIQELVQHIQHTKECSFDFETTGLNVYADGFRATLLSFSFQHGSSYCIPLENFDSPFNSRKKATQIIEYISKHIFANPNIRKIAHNIMFDVSVAAVYGFPEFRGRLDDTMLMHHLHDEQQLHGLKAIVATYFPDFEDYEKSLPHKSKNEIDWENIPMEKLAPYGGTDTDLTFRLVTVMEANLLQDERKYKIYRNQVMFAAKPLIEASRIGMPVGRKALNEYIKRASYLLQQQEDKILSNPAVKAFEAKKRKMVIDEELARLETTRPGKVGKNLTNLDDKIAAIKSGAKVIYEGLEVGSTDQMGEFFYQKYGLGYKRPWDKKKRKEGNSTNSKYIKKLVDRTGLIKDLLIHRTILKNLSTYLVAFLNQMDGNDRIHTTFKLYGTVTGRLACVGVDTIITTDVGDMRIGDLIPDYKGKIELHGGIKAKTHTGEYKTITHAINKGYEEMYKVELESGQVIECTMQHKFYTNKGWYSLKDILSSATEITIFYEEDNGLSKG